MMIVQWLTLQIIEFDYRQLQMHMIAASVYATEQRMQDCCVSCRGQGIVPDGVMQCKVWKRVQKAAAQRISCQLHVPIGRRHNQTLCGHLGGLQRASSRQEEEMR